MEVRRWVNTESNLLNLSGILSDKGFRRAQRNLTSFIFREAVDASANGRKCLKKQIAL